QLNQTAGRQIKGLDERGRSCFRIRDPCRISADERHRPGRFEIESFSLDFFTQHRIGEAHLSHALSELLAIFGGEAQYVENLFQRRIRPTLWDWRFVLFTPRFAHAPQPPGSIGNRAREYRIERSEGLLPRRGVELQHGNTIPLGLEPENASRLEEWMGGRSITRSEYPLEGEKRGRFGQ